MRILSLLIFLNICYVGFCAAPQSDNLREELRQQVEILKQQNAMLAQQVSELQDRLQSVDNSMEKYQDKQSVFSDLISMHAMWFTVVTGLLAGFLGLMGWRKYNQIEALMSATVNKLNEQLARVIEEHKEDEATVFGKIEEDRILLKKDLSNLYSAVLDGNYEINRSDVILLYILQFRNNLFAYDFYDNLSDRHKRTILDGDFISVMINRTSSLEECVDSFIKDKQVLNNRELLSGIKLFASLRLTDDMPRKEVFEKIRRRIVVKMEDYIEKQKKE